MVCLQAGCKHSEEACAMEQTYTCQGSLEWSRLRPAASHPRSLFRISLWPLPKSIRPSHFPSLGSRALNSALQWQELAPLLQKFKPALDFEENMLPTWK